MIGGGEVLIPAQPRQEADAAAGHEHYPTAANPAKTGYRPVRKMAWRQEPQGMPVRHRGTRRITVGGVEYRWRATGDDGYNSIGVWPANNVGPHSRGNLGHHETRIAKGDGSSSSTKGQIVVTNRIVRQIVEHVTAAFGYGPQVRGNERNPQVLDDVIEWGDALRGKGSG